jgi:hypothetical protein
MLNTSSYVVTLMFPNSTVKQFKLALEQAEKEL